MKIIKHRVDSIRKSKNLRKVFGVELDIRSHNGKIITGHNIFKKIFFNKIFINKIKKKFIIFDVKEEGIEKKLHTFIKHNKITNYFVINASVPKIIELLKKKIKINLSLRISCFENISNKKFFINKIKWIWVDSFNNEIPLKLNELKKITKNFHLCLVSPELVPSNNISTINFIKKNSKKIKFFSMVCTKKTSLWKQYT